ncbi:hypothetical protein GCM10012285_12840 [Streptomyces kronopolitis]|uniref:Uncharacterized protein n=2 Tax=Streptomyces kronopolitis TaxID=1612435 RepID=A0ABQ2J501_9ACTN|nr:hypothetical protein GCM10012285_12840 [Streptomyces kronopolitis]
MPLTPAAALPRTAGRQLTDEDAARDARETRSREEEWETDGGAATGRSGQDAEAGARNAAGPTGARGVTSPRAKRCATSPGADQEVTMKPAEALPSAGRAEVRIVAASPETARQVAEAIRRSFATTEQRSYPAGSDGGTRLHLTVDTTHPSHPARSWLAAGRTTGDNRPQADEI